MQKNYRYKKSIYYYVVYFMKLSLSLSLSLFLYGTYIMLFYLTKVNETKETLVALKIHLQSLGNKFLKDSCGKHIDQKLDAISYQLTIALSI